LADLKPIVSKAFAAMGEAHQTLADDARRAEYDGALALAPDDEQTQVAAILEAAHAFQRAEILMKKKDFVGAMKEAKTAYEADPSQADYAALYGWLQGMNRSDNFDELIKILDLALEKNSDNVRALWYRGQLLKRAGHHLRAIKDFRHIVDLKPNHVDARRELRVHQMRKKSAPRGDTGPSGFFGRFKKKT
jgi:tetratricopeptide (TPR) repeat protein